MVQLTPEQAALLAKAAKVLKDLAAQVSPKDAPEAEADEDDEDEDEDAEEESDTHGAYKP
jgi:hypothetical protein